MARFNEDTLNNWRNPPSDAEEARLNNAVNKIKEALQEATEMRTLSYSVFGQGSYANDTNVKLNSDVDVNVCYSGIFYYELPEGKQSIDFGIQNAPHYTFAQYKNTIEKVLVDKFGRTNVVRQNKCIRVKGDANRVEADVVPTWKFRRYKLDGNFVEGVRLISDQNEVVTNYPLQHIENGKQKNARTTKRFKRLTRIFKRVKNHMVDNGQPVDSAITSFLLECLVWNVPDTLFNNNETWTERLKGAITHIYNQTKDNGGSPNWREVSSQLSLFSSGRKWDKPKVNHFMLQMWRYLQF